MILIIDNYDSFVYNLSRYVEELGHSVVVVRNDKITIQDISQLQPSHIIISPGPCGPNEAGVSLDLVKNFYDKIPILGVCLGHQVIGSVFGGDVIQAKQPMHGKSCFIEHQGTGVFAGVPSPLKVGRYHSLIVSDKNLDKKLNITSRSAAGEIMSFAHADFNLVGLQFHPESLLTDDGHQLLKNFIMSGIKPSWMSLKLLEENQFNIVPNSFHWLVKPNNLTETIKQTGLQCSVNLLKQSFDKPYADEVAAFEQYDTDASTAFIRKVFLEDKLEPLVFARVIIPKETYLNYEDVFSNLGNAAIGNTLLYANQDIKRQAFEFRLIESGNPMFDELKKLNQVKSNHHKFWARRSIFILPKGPLLISEVFLNMPDYPI